MKVSAIFVAAAALSGVQAFQSSPQRTMVSSPTSLKMGLFDGFIKSMESGYAGGEESPYAKKIAAEEQKRKEFEEKKRKQRQQRGYRELKDYDPKKDKTFAKTKFDADGNKEDDLVSKWAKEAKAKQGGGFKFPWDN